MDPNNLANREETMPLETTSDPFTDLPLPSPTTLTTSTRPWTIDSGILPPIPTTRTRTITTADLGDPQQATPPQTATHALTTIYTAPSSCRDRFYISEITTKSFNSDEGISSGLGDRLYRSCQPEFSAYANRYSPGACPYYMDIVAVSSSSNTAWSETESETAVLLPPDGATTTLFHKPRDPAGAAVTYTDICCQSGFMWDFSLCYSIVSTPTSVLIAPYILTQDVRVAVSQVRAWHEPIQAIWQTTDLSLFPSDVRIQKSSIAESGFIVSSTSSITPMSTSTSVSQQTRSPDSTPRLSTGAIIGVGFAVACSVCLFIAAACLYRRRRRRERGRADRLGVGCIGVPKGWMKRGQRAELSSAPAIGYMPGSESNQLEHVGLHRAGEVQTEGKESPAELDGEPGVTPRFSYEFQGHESNGSLNSDRIASFKPVPNQHPGNGL